MDAESCQKLNNRRASGEGKGGAYGFVVSLQLLGLLAKLLLLCARHVHLLGSSHCVCKKKEKKNHSLALERKKHFITHSGSEAFFWGAKRLVKGDWGRGADPPPLPATLTWLGQLAQVSDLVLSTARRLAPPRPHTVINKKEQKGGKWLRKTRWQSTAASALIKTLGYERQTTGKRTFTKEPNHNPTQLPFAAPYCCSKHSICTWVFCRISSRDMPSSPMTAALQRGSRSSTRHNSTTYKWQLPKAERERERCQRKLAMCSPGRD